jgi:hypothetical protein
MKENASISQTANIQLKWLYGGNALFSPEKIPILLILDWLMPHNYPIS